MPSPWGTQPSVLLAPKTNISPLIKGARWVAFLSGVAYGMTRLHYLTVREEALMKREDVIRERKAEKAKILQEKHLKEHMLDIAKQMGHTPVHKD